MLTEKEIGNKIKEIRKSQKVTLQELADKTELTKSYLSKVERSLKGPPISTLMRIAEALNVKISEILEETEESSLISVVKQDERQVIARNGSRFGYNYYTLAHKFSNRRMDPYFLIRPPHAKKDLASFKHRDQEMLFLLEGKMEFHHGSKTYILEKGDCVYFDGNIEHHGNNIGDSDIQALMIVCSQDRNTEI